MLEDILDFINGSWNIGDFEVETEMEYQYFDEDNEDGKKKDYEKRN